MKASIGLGVALLLVSPLFIGLYLAFKASVVLGLLVMLVEPSPWIIGICAMFGHPELCQKLAAWLGLA